MSALAKAEAPNDIVTDAVWAGHRESGHGARAPSVEVKEARRIANAVRRVPDARDALAPLLAFVRRYPEDERFQTLVARVLDRVQDARAEQVWRGVDERFPRSRDAYVRMLRWTIRLKGRDAGLTLHAERFPDAPDDPVELFLYARGLLELRDVAEAESCFTRLAEMDGAPASVLLDLAGHLLSQGQPFRARDILRLVEGRHGASRESAKTAARIEAATSSLARLLPGAGEGAASRDALVVRLFAEAQTRRAARLDGGTPRFLGPIVMINGSLGSGGAERQFTNTALALDAAMRSGEPVAGVDVIGPLHVVCRSLHSRQGADFFAAQFAEAGLQVHQYMHFPEYGGRVRHSLAKPALDYLDHLPPQMREGVVRLSDMLRYFDPQVAHIWQDGSVLATGLAALLAGVPRIVLGVRTLPPVDRFERNKPEYEAVYRALMAAPNVVLLSNSHMAARRYEAWLGLAPGSVAVSPNGLSPLDTAPDASAAEMAAAFDAQAQGGFTMGSVMRMDDNKRPLLWLEAAAAVLARAPQSRFILVGDGPLLATARAHAETLGIAAQVLFVGRSARVGYWLSKMDVFLLLSRHEGLPNVLIEAQMAGVPVVSTPAGGAAETVWQGVAGTILPQIEPLDPEAVATQALAWRLPPERREAAAHSISIWASENFSIAHMIETTVEAYFG